MQQIIANTYEIEREIGSGGGGVVYLAHHLRLDKKVVLKADRRTVIKTKPEVLRQEVDVLKNLSHTYIPQVYDFFVENDIVYTVMDYIEGESFDRPLKRGQHFSQVQVIEWACQLLEALIYLHSRPPYGILHGDIKPANVMLTPNNEIRLIDFNIALALGAEGAVKVGFSRGYASPEHYGQLLTPMREEIAPEIDTVPLQSENKTEVLATEALTTEVLATDLLPETPSVKNLSQNKGPSQMSRSSVSGGRLLDVRSDIYSLGATLYHILTGVRPAADAREVAPITGPYSPAVCAIIQKAMAPDPADRYQTAAEMLDAFTHLHTRDVRSKRLSQMMKVTAALLSLLFLAGSSTAFVGLKQMEQEKQAYVLAEYAENALQSGDVSTAISYALQALPEKKTLFSLPYTTQAQKALTDALGVYDLSDGFKTEGIITLPSEPLQLTLSPDGKFAAAVYAYQVAIFDMVTQAQLAELPVEPSALSEICFLDNVTLLYAGEDGLCAYDIVQQQKLWQGEKATAIVISADGDSVAAIHKAEDHAVIYDAHSGERRGIVSFNGKKQKVAANDGFADPRNKLFALNQDGTLLAVSFEDGSLTVFDLQQPENDLEIYDNSPYTKFTGGFYQQYFAFTAANSEESVFAVIDVEKKAQTGGFSSQRPFLVQVDETGIYVALDNLLVQLDPESGAQQEKAYTNSDIVIFQRNADMTLLATKENQYQFFDKQAYLITQAMNDYPCDFVCLAGKTALIGSHNSPVLRILRLETNEKWQVFSYDATYLHDEARINASQTTVMLFRYDRFRLYRLDGTIIADVRLPQAEQVYDQQYRRGEELSWLEVVYNDGMVRCYSAEDGTLFSETQGEKPDTSLTEEFFTEQFHIVAPLHETPVVYDKQSGEKFCELEKDDYLTYVTQVDEYIITEYITAAGDRYGLLLNENCEILAKLPGLCDILGKELIFDYKTGDLRRSPIYSLEELRTIAANQI